MNTLESRNGEYRGWSKEKAIGFLGKLVSTIHGDVALGVGQTMVMQDYTRIALPIVKALRELSTRRVAGVGKKDMALLDQMANLYNPPYSHLLKAWLEHVSMRLPALPTGEKIRVFSIKTLNSKEGSVNTMRSS